MVKSSKHKTYWIEKMMKNKNVEKNLSVKI